MTRNSRGGSFVRLGSSAVRFPSVDSVRDSIVFSYSPEIPGRLVIKSHG